MLLLRYSSPCGVLAVSGRSPGHEAERGLRARGARGGDDGPARAGLRGRDARHRGGGGPVDLLHHVPGQRWQVPGEEGTAHPAAARQGEDRAGHIQGHGSGGTGPGEPGPRPVPRVHHLPLHALLARRRPRHGLRVRRLRGRGKRDINFTLYGYLFHINTFIWSSDIYVS